jgi:hypothetical protein
VIDWGYDYLWKSCWGKIRAEQAMAGLPSGIRGSQKADFGPVLLLFSLERHKVEKGLPTES